VQINKRIFEGISGPSDYQRPFFNAPRLLTAGVERSTIRFVGIGQNPAESMGISTHFAGRDVDGTRATIPAASTSAGVDALRQLESL